MPTKVRPPAIPARLAAVLLVLALATVGVVIGERQAQASHVDCGDTITTDTTLDSDLLNCPSNGIVIGADDITLNLDGHRITGDGELVEPCPDFCDVGILLNGHNRVTVRNGSVRRFALGLFVLGARRDRVLRISASGNTFFGFAVTESARSLIRRSSGSGNLPPDGDGLGLFSSHHVRIVRSSFRHNPLGIHIEDSSNNLIKGNRIKENSGPGIFVQANENTMRRNRCARNGICILVGPGNRNSIRRNRAFRDADGIAIEKGRGNVVAGNVVARPRGGGVMLGIERPSIGGGNNTVVGNRVRRSGDDGFVVARKDDHSRLSANVARRAGGDGFDVASPSTKLSGNKAVNNADLGIEAVEGVIDGGGNIARRNGDPRQCIHMSCS